MLSHLSSGFPLTQWLLVTCCTRRKLLDVLVNAIPEPAASCSPAGIFTPIAMAGVPADAGATAQEEAAFLTNTPSYLVSHKGYSNGALCNVNLEM